MTDRPTASTINDAQLDQLYDDLEHARRELADRDAADSADAAAGSYAGRAERVEQQLTAVADLIADHEGDEWAAHPATTVLRGILDSHDHAIAQPGRWLHIAFTSPDATTANTSALALADHVRAEFPGVGMRITTNAAEVGALTAAEEARLAQTGINTPGCDCGHEGMGVSWHGDECPWRRDVLDGTVPALREQLAAALRSLAIIGDTPPRLLVPVFTGGGSQLAQIVDWRPLGDLVDTLHAIVTGHAATITEGRDRARDTLTLIGERCDMADILHKPITTADVRAWLRGTRCARARAAEQPARTTPDDPAGT